MVNTFNVMVGIATILSSFAMFGIIPATPSNAVVKNPDTLEVSVFFEDAYGKEALKKDKNFNVDVLTDTRISGGLVDNPITVRKMYSNRDDSKDISKDIKVGVCGSHHSYPHEINTVTIYVLEKDIDKCKKLFPLPK